MQVQARDLLVRYAINEKGDWNKIYRSVINKENVGCENIIKEEFITILDKEYPERLRKIYRPPFVLFYKGDISLLNNTKLINIGAIRNGFYKTDLVNLMDLIYDKKFVYIVNHNTDIGKEIIKQNGKVIVILNGGFNTIEEKLVQKIVMNGGLIITEYPNDVFQSENDNTRISSGLEDKLIVVSSKKSSSVMLQITHSLYLGHDKIYAMPESPLQNRESQNNKIIDEGATIFYNKKQLEE